MPHPDTATTQAEQPETELPPFSGEQTECVKCSDVDTFTRFRPSCPRGLWEYNGRTTMRGPLPERLERQCSRCDYQWDEALNPSPGVRPATHQDVAYALQQAARRWQVDLPTDLLTQMAAELGDTLHLLVRLDHPMWLPRPGRPLLVSPQEEIPEDSTGLTSGMSIVYHDQVQPPAGPTAFTKAAES
ncbi:hypothetical protein ACFWXA_13160 [Streptomyces atroolivaceus]|uniref:hypothetical protein n=1 Tax=Streptomyces atroolivaceus TaxID=66869 RepID=UPI00365A20CA